MNYLNKSSLLPKIASLFCLLLLAGGGGRHTIAKAEPPFRRAMNIGNALDAPRNQPWDVTLRDQYFTVIKEAGFDAVRLPVRFSDYTGEAPDYQLDKKFMRKLDRHIKYALVEGLTLILDVHHFVELMAEPAARAAQFLAIWRQLAARYKDYPDKLVFEVLNEPSGQLYGELWNDYLAKAVGIIRESNPKRHIIVGPDTWNSLDGLQRLRLPATGNLVLTFHYYLPIEFTFQGHEHLGYEELTDVAWQGTAEELSCLRGNFFYAQDFSRQHNIPVFLGEFGANEKAPPAMRAAWTAAVRRQAEELGFAWGYWEFAASFGAYDVKKRAWRQDILAALLE